MAFQPLASKDEKTGAPAPEQEAGTLLLITVALAVPLGLDPVSTLVDNVVARTEEAVDALAVITALATGTAGA